MGIRQEQGINLGLGMTYSPDGEPCQGLSEVYKEKVAVPPAVSYQNKQGKAKASASCTLYKRDNGM